MLSQTRLLFLYPVELICLKAVFQERSMYSLGLHLHSVQAEMSYFERYDPDVLNKCQV